MRVWVIRINVSFNMEVKYYQMRYKIKKESDSYKLSESGKRVCTEECESVRNHTARKTGNSASGKVIIARRGRSTHIRAGSRSRPGTTLRPRVRYFG